MRTWIARLALWIFTLSLIAGLIAALYLKRPQTPEFTQEQRLPLVSVWQTQADYHDLSRQVTVQVSASRSQLITAPSSLEITQVYVQNGEWVKPGDQLIDFDPKNLGDEQQRVILSLDELKLNISTRQIQQQLDQKRLQQALEDLDRAETLLTREQALEQKGLSSKDAVERQTQQRDQQLQAIWQLESGLQVHQNTLESLQIQKQRLQLQLDELEAKLKKLPISSDMPGTISNLNLSVGQWVSERQVLASVKSSELRASVTYLADQYQAGLAYELELNNKRFPLSQVLILDANRVELQFDLGTAPGLNDGERHYALLHIPQRQLSYLVPDKALKDYAQVFWVDDQQIVHARKVDMIGATEFQQQYYWMVVADRADSLQLITTQLNSLVEGMKVEVGSVEGIDL